MKTVKTVMFVVVLLLAPVYAHAANQGYMRISHIEGEVQIKTTDAEDWGYASINTPLAEGDEVWIPQDAKVELQLNTGTYIRLDQSSALQILSMDEDSSQFYLTQGYAYIFYDAPARGGVIQVDTPDASTRAFDNAVFRIDMSEQYTDVGVYKGYVETENNVGNTRINEGQMVSLGQNTDGELAPMGPPDEWERWNKARNHSVYAERGASSRYLPAELSAYSYDLDNSGRWVQDPHYGHVWTPRIAAGGEWSPYRDGRWVWRGGDYVWVGSESWGWAPYHYGRWSFEVSIGWFWVPPVAREVYWSPGNVGWVRTRDYVAWVPLAPEEIYYGRGNYGRNSVNITNVNINQVNITNVYQNVNVNNGVTVVNRNTFNTGAPTIVNVNKNIIQKEIFVRDNFSVGTPDIKPTRASHFASTRQIQPAKLPPQHVRNQHVQELRHSRPLIKDRDKSVLNPGAKPRSLRVNAVTTPRAPGRGTPMIQQVRPAEREKAAAPEVGPTGRGQRQQVKPAEREKAAVPEVGPTGRGQRQQVKPAEREKAAAPEVGPTGRGQRQQVKPAEREKAAAPEVGPTGRGQRQQVKPAQRVKPAAPEVAPAVREKRQQVKPAQRVKPAAPEVAPAVREKRQQVKPAQREKPAAPEVTPAVREKRQQVKPAQREKPAAPEVAPAVREKRQQVRPAQRVKPAAPEAAPAVREKRQQVKPDKKGKPGEPECGPGQKDEKNPKKCPQKK